MDLRGARRVYNRYIPTGSRYETASAGGGFSHAPSPSGPGQRRGGLSALLGSLGGGNGGEGVSQALSGLLQKFHLEDLDTGDILLALIVLLLILEDGDNLDLIIALGLMILFRR